MNWKQKLIISISNNDCCWILWKLVTWLFFWSFCNGYWQVSIIDTIDLSMVTAGCLFVCSFFLDHNVNLIKPPGSWFSSSLFLWLWFRIYVSSFFCFLFSLVKHSCFLCFYLCCCCCCWCSIELQNPDPKFPNLLE